MQARKPDQFGPPQNKDPEVLILVPHMIVSFIKHAVGDVLNLTFLWATLNYCSNKL